MKTWNFGILGPGRIAHRFAAAFQHVANAKVCAVASRDGERAEVFAKQYSAPKFYSSYEDMARDPEVDVVYVATPHPFHHEQTLLCLQNKKAVVCEKPMAMNLEQCREMIETAKKNEVFLMEGMWSRFFPWTEKVLELVGSGTIGEIKYLHADFGFAAPVNMESRVYKLSLGGGAQLDVGVYPLFLSLLLLGKPTEIKAFSHLAETGADATTGALLYYRDNTTAHIFSSIITESPKEAHIMGTKGSIIIRAPWYKSEHVTLQMHSGERTEFPCAHSGNGFEFQIAEVVKCLEEEKLESERMPHSLSLIMAETADEILRQGGVKYERV